MKALSHRFAAHADTFALEIRQWSASSHHDDEHVARVSDPCSRIDSAKVAQRFPKSSKLLRHADFQRVYKHGRRHFAAHMTVFYFDREDGNSSRIGFTVGRVLGGAVERNRIKRRLREAVRYNLASLRPGVDVVINPKKSALTADFDIFKNEVARAFQVIGGRESRRV